MMLNIEWEKIATAYDLIISEIKPIQSGLINNTFKVATQRGDFIVQQLNTVVFKDVDAIADNISKVGNYLKNTFPDYLFTHPVPQQNGECLFKQEDLVFRVFPFINNTHTIQTTSSPHEAYEAAYQFALFTKKLTGFPLATLHETIPRFHDLQLRYHQFEQAVKANNGIRKTKASALIKEVLERKDIVNAYEYFINHKDAKKRVMHHDTKISNVLFDAAGKGVTVIDLDTIMPGYLLSDVGDMLRTYIANVSEEETDLDLIFIRDTYVKAIEQGYKAGLGNEINSFESDNFYLFGSIMMYMQALRFLTDYLEYDIYYGETKEDQNLKRALNQYRLLELFEELYP